MKEPKSVLQVVAERFPDLKPDEAKKLVLSSLNWLTNVGAIASKRLTGLTERDTLIEQRAQAIAFGVLEKMMTLSTTSDEDQIEVIVNVLQAINTSIAPPPIGS